MSRSSPKKDLRTVPPNFEKEFSTLVLTAEEMVGNGHLSFTTWVDHKGDRDAVEKLVASIEAAFASGCITYRVERTLIEENSEGFIAYYRFVVKEAVNDAP